MFVFLLSLLLCSIKCYLLENCCTNTTTPVKVRHKLKAPDDMNEKQMCLKINWKKRQTGQRSNTKYYKGCIDKTKSNENNNFIRKGGFCFLWVSLSPSNLNLGPGNDEDLFNIIIHYTGCR